MDIRNVCVELQSLGVKFSQSYRTRKGGAGPAEGTTIVINDRFINVPSVSGYVSLSPYSIKHAGTSLGLFKNDKKISNISMPALPNYYSLKTDRGYFLNKIALLHGRDCLASTVFQDCIYLKNQTHCRFCGIAVSLTNRMTLLKKNPEDLAFTAKKAMMLDNVRHVTLTTGMMASKYKTADHLADCVRAIKEKTSLPIHIQITPPDDIFILERLKKAGADTIGIHIETFDVDILTQIAPCKAKIGLRQYRLAWKNAVSIFGRNQVSSFLIAGLGESPSSIIEGAELLCEIGVFPFIVPFRPIPSTSLENHSPPEPEKMFLIYEKAGLLLKKYGLSSALSKAGCVKCGSCSCLSLFE